MYVFSIRIACLQDMELSIAQQVLTQLMDEYRYNGQVIGREFPIILVGEHFEITCVCPEQSSLDTVNSSAEVMNTLQTAHAIGLGEFQFELLGLETQSDFTDICTTPKGYILYSTFVQSCSPVRCTEHFSPIPLYKLPKNVRKRLIKWQESQAACDQLQMNDLKEVEVDMINQLMDWQSELMQQAKEIAIDIEQVLNVPVYIYLYRVGGNSKQAELERTCPKCDSDWKLSSPLFDLFDFKCDACHLLSNISWDWQ